MKYSDIWWSVTDYFCISEEKVQKFPEVYEEIVKVCDRIVTDDNVVAYVAKKKRHFIGYHENIYNSLKEYSTEYNQRYADVTDLKGLYFSDIRCYNWAAENPHLMYSYTIPKVRKGSRLFYSAN